MRTVGCILVALLVWADPADAGPYFIDGQGEKVDLVEASDRVVVRLTAGAWNLLDSMPELDLGPGVRRRGELTELPLSPGYRGSTEDVYRKLHEAGLVDRRGVVFSEPNGDRTIALDREVIVKMRERGLPGGWLRAAGLSDPVRLDREGRLYVFRAADARAALVASVAASRRADVEWAIPDFYVPVDLFHRPNDPYYGQQWHHHQPSGAHIGSEAAWDITMGDSQVIVAVIDTGVEEGHPDFDPARIVTGYNSVTGSNDPTPLTGSIDAHGTCCAGSIVAKADNGEGIAGVCPGCSLMGIKMMDGMATEAQLSTAYQAIEYATTNGAWVISNSWGNIPQNLLTPFYDAVRDAVNNGRAGMGSVVLFASGNGNMLGQAERIESWELQAMPEVMTVGGTGPDDMRVGYSDYGSNLSIVAPTGDMDPSDWQNPFQGPQIFTTDSFGNSGGFSRNGYYWQPSLWGGDEQTSFAEADPDGNYTQYFNGTSAACPIAAGVVALTWSANPDLTAAQVRQVVEQTADKVGDQAYDANGHNDYYGYGRVNAARAVRAAARGFDNPDGAVCAEDFNCLEGQCAKVNPDDPEGICAQSCVTQADCGAGRSCAQLPGGPKVCLDACSGHQECQDGSVCTDDGACLVVACTDGSECPDGTACPLGGGVCRVVCGDDLDCTQPALCLPAGGGELCRAVACETSQDCPPDTACPEGGGHCVRSCTSDADCIPPEKCLPSGNGKLCQTIACASSDDCPADMECGQEGICVPTTDECELDADCPEGWRCANGYCFEPQDGDDGGCGCGASGPSPGSLLFLAGLAWVRRRNRKR